MSGKRYIQEELENILGVLRAARRSKAFGDFKRYLQSEFPQFLKLANLKRIFETHANTTLRNEFRRKSSIIKGLYLLEHSLIDPLIKTEFSISMLNRSVDYSPPQACEASGQITDTLSWVDRITSHCIDTYMETLGLDESKLNNILQRLEQKTGRADLKNDPDKHLGRLFLHAETFPDYLAVMKLRALPVIRKHIDNICREGNFTMPVCCCDDSFLQGVDTFMTPPDLKRTTGRKAATVKLLAMG